MAFSAGDVLAEDLLLGGGARVGTVRPGLGL